MQEIITCTVPYCDHRGRAVCGWDQDPDSPWLVRSHDTHWQTLEFTDGAADVGIVGIEVEGESPGTPWVHVDTLLAGRLTAADARQLAAALLTAADKLDEIAGMR